MFNVDHQEILESMTQNLAHLYWVQFFLIGIAAVMLMMVIITFWDRATRSKKITDERMDYVKPQSYLVVTKNNEWATTTAGRRATWWKIFWSEF